jgi:hypothetical protein
MNVADYTELTGELRTVDVSSQLFLSSKQVRDEQLQITGGLYVGEGVFASPEQNYECNSDSETESDTEGGKQISGGSSWSGGYEDQ